MSSYKEACQSSSNAFILPSISDEAIDHMQDLFSSKINEILQETIMELKASTQSPGISQDTNHTETEQAQAGYEEIRETLGPAIPDWPRIMPGYQSSSSEKNQLIPDREMFLCSSLLVSDHFSLTNDDNYSVEKCYEPVSSLSDLTVENMSPGGNVCNNLVSSHLNQSESVYSAESTVEMEANIQATLQNQTSLSSTQEGCLESSSNVNAIKNPQALQTGTNLSAHNLEACSISENESTMHDPLLSQSRLSVSDQNSSFTVITELEQEPETCNGSCNPIEGWVAQSLQTANDVTLCHDRPGPKPPDLASCYRKKFRYKD